jgi:NAD(P)-dependent dehydrogenase (short-subunit alcohol dehydrogenase family)/uncharacterized OB-fold protein
MSVLLPPSARSRAALGLTAAAAQGRFELQVCEQCGALQYPPRETCVKCLSGQLTWRKHSGRGQLLAATTVHHSNHAYFRGHAPWHIGMVRLDGNVTVIAHLHHAGVRTRGDVVVRALLDRSGQGVLFAFPTQAASAAEPDSQVMEMTCMPQGKRVLVTDGSSPLGRALVEALLSAGAQTVWSGMPVTAKTQATAGPKELHVSLEVTDAQSVATVAAELASRVDVLINNSEVHGTSAALGGSSLEVAQAQMNTHCWGMIRLADAFAPRLVARAHEQHSRPTAWVNVLSMYALSSLPSHASFSASKAAALSFAQSLRAKLRSSGMRVLNVFPGPVDEPAFKDLPQPKLAPKALAHAIVEALKSGQEDCYPGEVAQDFMRRWREDPKLVELELQL